MESYPLEFVLHQVPLVAVVGLSCYSVLPPLPVDVDKNSPMYLRAVQDQTSAHVRKLLLTLLTAKNNIGLWDSPTSKSLYKIMAVDKSHAFPKRQLISKTIGTTHMSSLSPNNPNSLLYPDGIITPHWPSKHRELVPGVVVGIYDLWESVEQVNRNDPLGVQQISGLERDRDQILANEINEKRKQIHEAGLKFAIIIIVKTFHPDDPFVDERLSYIRRASMIDRQHQFTLSAYSQNGNIPDLVPFVEGLQRGLLEITSVYYREHEKRIKRKRAKLSPTGKPTGSMLQANPHIRPLSSQAWSVRYDFKLGFFAECRQDLEAAIRHYDTAYTGIINILHQSQKFGGTLAPGGGNSGSAEITPGSLRWTEARIFADSLSIKMFKLLLYCGHTVNALVQLHKHFVHCREFPEFAFTTASFDGSANDESNVSGLGHLKNTTGGGSFQYWAWASTQYRAFGELIEIASSKTQLVLPYPPPGFASNQAQSILNTVSNTGLNLIAGEAATSLFSPFSSVNPVFTVQHAGFYYVLAARCAEERWNKFKKGIASIMPSRTLSRQSVRNHSRSSSVDSLPPPTPLDLENATDHTMNIIELLTKGYEQFKKYKSSRMTLYLASDIARVYEEGKKYDMALKFFDRIGKTYRKEGWFTILASINRWMIKCALQLQLHAVALESIVELLSHQLTPLVSDRQAIFLEIQTILQGNVSQATSLGPDGVLDVQLDMDQLTSFLQCNVQLKTSQAHVLESINYQLVLSALPRALSQSSRCYLPVNRILVKFSNSEYDMCLLPLSSNEPISMQTEIASARPIELIDCCDAVYTTVPQEGGRLYWVKYAPINIITGTSKIFEGVINASKNQELKIISVSIILESPSIRLAMIFNIQQRPSTFTKRQWLILPAGESIPRYIGLPNVGELSCIRIDQRELKVSHQYSFVSPGYIDELVPITIRLTNQESESMHLFISCRVCFGSDSDGAPDIHSRLALNKVDFDTPFDDKAYISLERPSSPQHFNSMLQIDMGTVEPNATIDSVFYLRVQSKPGPRVLVTTLYGFFASAPLTISAFPGTSMLDLTDTRLLSKLCSTEDGHISCECPFETSSELAQYGTAALPIDSPTGILCGTDDIELDIQRTYKWLLTSTVRMIGKWEIEVEHAELNVDNLQNLSSTTVQVEPVSQPETSKEWLKGHSQGYAFRVTTRVDVLSTSLKIDIGRLALKWRRLKPALGAWTCTFLDMPEPKLSPEILRINATIPGDLAVGTPFELRYTIQNTTIHLAELLSYMESSEHFVFAGYKQMNYKLLPLSTQTLTFQLVPLSSGRCALPNFKTMKQTDAALLFSDGASGAAEGGNTFGSTIRDKLFPVLADKPHMHGSRHGELYVYVRPTIGW
ncbi:hypothetical protein QVD99_000865 [Batrachochytrium dendrobatidis]|nr:hypothetical protein QVD99_000865 [Batrachochytrium dendrobatidis]